MVFPQVPRDPVVPSQKVGLGWVPGGSSRAVPEKVRLDP